MYENFSPVDGPVGGAPYAAVPAEASPYAPVVQKPQGQLQNFNYTQTVPVFHLTGGASVKPVNQPPPYVPNPYLTKPYHTIERDMNPTPAAAPANTYQVNYAAPDLGTTLGVSCAIINSRNPWDDATRAKMYTLYRIAIAVGGIMVLAGVSLLVASPPKQCPAPCVRDDCYEYSDDQEQGHREIFDCLCTHSDGTEFCKNATQPPGSMGFYFLLFGVLAIVFGGLPLIIAMAAYSVLNYQLRQRQFCLCDCLALLLLGFCINGYRGTPGGG